MTASLEYLESPTTNVEYPAPVTGQEELPTHEHKQSPKKKWSKRTKIAAGVVAIGALTGGAAFAAQVYENATYTREAVTKEVAPAKETRHDDTTTVAITGFNTSRNQTRLSAQALEPALGQVGAVSWVGYPDTGIDIPAMTDTVEAYLQDNNYMTPNFYLSSMGGLVGLEIVSELAKRGAEAPDFIILDSTPASWDDLRKPRQVELMRKLNTPLAKSAFSSVQSVVERKKNPVEAVGDFFYNTFGSKEDPEKTTSKLLDSQVDFIKNFNVRETAADIPTSTDIYYIGGGEKDTTVDTDSSCLAFQQAFSEHAVECLDTSSPHASPIGDTKQYLQTITPLMAKYRTPPGNAQGGNVARLAK